MAENSKIEWTDHTFNPWTGRMFGPKDWDLRKLALPLFPSE